MRKAVRKDFGSSFFVAVIPTLKDNFSYLIQDKTTGTLTAVDANQDIKPLLSYMDQEKLGPVSTILSTHKHWDHAGGNQSLKAEMLKRGDVRDVQVVGGRNDSIPAATETVAQGDSVMLGSLHVRVLDVPCHTKGHVAYIVSNPANKNDGAAVFTGDTLFLGGLGAFFEGTAEDMCVAMDRLYNINKENNYTLDAKTFIFPGHEYTAGFMKFAAKVSPREEPENVAFIQAQGKKYADLVAQGLPSVPSSLADEKKQNLFLRVGEPAFQQLMKKGSSVKLMDYLYNACD